ncbi:hypothetical protein L3V83_12650 [Thiotrichales bacterium 19X7-9]|nr:hypothetical protein [Thiotrichales bacterium 19X7-9]
MLNNKYLLKTIILSISLLFYQFGYAKKVIYVDINEEIVKGPTVFYDEDIAFTEIDNITNTSKKPVTLLDVPENAQLNIQKKLKNFDQEMAQDNDVTYSIYDNFDVQQDYTKLPLKVVRLQALMSKMPVLDQGPDGACVTFASTGALNILYKGANDSISQKCSLNLGQWLSTKDENFFLSNKQKYPNLFKAAEFIDEIDEEEYSSGWDGSYGYIVLSQISEFGTVAKNQQNSQVCGKGPKKENDKIVQQADSIAPEKYQKLVGHAKDYQWQSLCNPIKPCQRQVIEQIKQALNQGHLVVFGVTLPEIGSNGTSYKYYPNLQAKTNYNLNDNAQYVNLENNVFAYTDKVHQCMKNKQCEKNSGGHEMFIYGYQENPNQPGNGIFYVRNSWGDDVGDYGDYYMTYNFADKMMMEAYEIKRP